MLLFKGNSSVLFVSLFLCFQRLGKNYCPGLQSSRIGILFHHRTRWSQSLDYSGNLFLFYFFSQKKCRKNISWCHKVKLCHVQHYPASHFRKTKKSVKLFSIFKKYFLAENWHHRVDFYVNLTWTKIQIHATKFEFRAYVLQPKLVLKLIKSLNANGNRFFFFVFSACGGIRAGSKLPVLTAFFPVLA